MISRRKALSLVIFLTTVPCTYSHIAHSNGADGNVQEEMVVTGVHINSPLTVETDPRIPRQPLPAQDGADYLKTIPGFSVIRKGGTSGDPVFRGMAGSRLSLLQNGDLVLGGCGGRMDPPTAYIFPETYDRIRLIKGPQTVLYGPGNSAGVVLFERDQLRLSESGWKLHSSLLGGSFNRNDQVVDISGGTPDFFLRGMVSHSQQDDYRDGDSASVHSEYNRWGTNLTLGWTPSDKVALELAASRSAAEAAYADRGMDGSVFDRDNLSVKLTLQQLSPLWQKIEARAYYNYVDHVMDNYTLRIPPGMPMASNPDRRTEGASVLAALAPSRTTEWVVGVDTQANDHSNRATSNQQMMPFQNMPREADASFSQIGVFGEWTQHLVERQRLIAGLRLDNWHAEDMRDTRSIGDAVVPNPSARNERKENLSSGFIRYEKDVQPVTVYAGLGRNQRFPDYWELINKESENSITAFNIRPETTTQLDIGAIYNNSKGLKGSVSLFYSQVDDYLLIQSRYDKPTDAGTRMTTVARNVDVTTWGLEADIHYTFANHWRVEASLASVRGSNETDSTHLAQMTPLELRTGIYYNNPAWTAGVFWRIVDEQARVDINKGNIAGQDIGPSDSFNIVSLNFGWRAHKNLLVTSGVDNLLDQSYSEHISKSGALIAGYEQTARVNEPGRTFWLKIQLTFE